MSKIAHHYIWPTSKPIVVSNVFGSGISLLKEKFGALSQGSDLYSRICVGNSVFSLEPFRGCTLGCVYCMGNNDMRSLRKTNLKDSAIIRRPEKLYDSIELLYALVEHPAFIPNKSVIGFCTGSSEVFLEGINDNVWEAMELMVSMGLKNPIWLVVKSFGECDSDKWHKRFRFLTNNNIDIIISITDAGLPASIEPFQPKNRFAPFKEFTNDGVVLSHHLRPIIPGVSSFKDLLSALEKSKDVVSSVCIGGLRIDPGMKLFWKSDESDDCNYIPGNQNKELDESLTERVTSVAEAYGLPIFLHSSEMISYHLGIHDYNLHKYRQNDDCFLDFGKDLYRIIDNSGNGNLLSSLRNIAVSIGLDVSFISNSNGTISLSEELGYPEKHALIQAIGHSDLFQGV